MPQVKLTEYENCCLGKWRKWNTWKISVNIILFQVTIFWFLVLLTIRTLVQRKLFLTFLKENWLRPLFSSDEVDSPTKKNIYLPEILVYDNPCIIIFGMICQAVTVSYFVIFAHHVYNLIIIERLHKKNSISNAIAKWYLKNKCLWKNILICYRI